MAKRQLPPRFYGRVQKTETREGRRLGRCRNSQTGKVLEDMAKVDTLPEYLKPLMDGCTVRQNRCAVCGATWPLNQHHIVYRSAGKMFRHGVEVEKPTITLCGNGNTGGCHGRAHAHLLHFRWVKAEVPDPSVGYQPRSHPFTVRGGHWEYLETEEPMSEFEALEVEEGWKPVNSRVE